MDAIEARASRQEEEWLVILTTDHSGRWIDHEYFYSGPESRKIWLIIMGDGLKKNYEIPEDVKIPISHKDVFPTVIEYLGL